MEGPPRSPGSFGWDGAYGTSFWIDPTEQLIGILMTQRVPEAIRTPELVLDFWTAAYQCLEV